MGLPMNQRIWFIILSLTLIGLLLSATPLITQTPALRPAEAQQLTRAERNWEFLNHNEFGTNYNPQTQLNKDNVQYLVLKWVYPIPSSSQLGCDSLVGFGSCSEGTQAPPLVVDGVVYTILNRKSVIAMDAETGDVIWTWEHPVVDNDDFQVRYPIAAESAHTHGMYFSNGLLWFTDFGCIYTGLDPQTGEIAKQITDTCIDPELSPPDKEDPRGFGIPTNSGVYRSRGPHPPTIWPEENIIFHPLGGHAEGTFGGRFYISARDFTTGDLLWRTFLQPPCADPLTCGPGKDGPIFIQEKAEYGQWLIDNCDRIWIQQIKSCELDQDLLRNDWGDMRSNSGISNVWGQMPIDKETGILYIGMAQPGPDWNATYAPGFRLFGSSVVAVDGRTGDLVWAHQTTARDLWDYDCSWNTILTDAVVKGEDTKVIIKGCKNGIVYVFDAATGEALHLLEAPQVLRTPNAQLLDPRSIADMTKPWMNYPDIGPNWMNCQTTGCIESDIAYDSSRNMVYFGTYNIPQWAQVGNADVRGVSVAGCRAACREARASPDAPFEALTNATINAYDVDTGRLIWEYFMDGVGFRGGTMVSGGIVWFAAVDGWSRGLDADTGEVLYEANMGTSSAVQPTVAADSNGDMKLFRVIGGRSIRGIGSSQPGAIMAYGLPDQLPVPEVVEVVREVQVPVEVEVPVEVIREVPVEVIQEVEVQVISPISYVAIGVGVVLVVVAGILFTRRKST